MAVSRGEQGDVTVLARAALDAMPVPAPVPRDARAAIREKFTGQERDACLWGWQAGWSAHEEGAYAALARLGSGDAG